MHTSTSSRSPILSTGAGQDCNPSKMRLRPSISERLKKHILAHLAAQASVNSKLSSGIFGGDFSIGSLALHPVNKSNEQTSVAVGDVGG